VIEVLDLSEPHTLAEVARVQRAAYLVEAELIGFDGIPPLHESLADLAAAPLQWRGIRRDRAIVAAVAFTGEGRRCDIDRLFVDPLHHRRGYGRRLVQALMHHEAVTVSTGDLNTPAVELYHSLGFRTVGRREVAPGVWVAQFEYRHDHLRTSFDADVAGYERARPGYPDQLFELLERCGLGAGTRVLEIGPGTGQATLPLLDRGASVVAVEPGPAMAARLRERVAGRPCTVVVSDLETAHLTGPFHLAVAATSFHWVDPVVGLDKLAGLVPSGGWLAVWWNVFRDVGPHDAEFAALLQPIARRFQTAERVVAITTALDEPARRAEIERAGHFEVTATPRFDWSITHDGPSLRALFASFSDWSTLPEPDRSKALDDVGAIVDDHFGGSITRTYSTKLYLARRR
jgi:SAM-dependent methyltransferase